MARGTWPTILLATPVSTTATAYGSWILQGSPRKFSVRNWKFTRNAKVLSHESFPLYGITLGCYSWLHHQPLYMVSFHLERERERERERKEEKKKKEKEKEKRLRPAHKPTPRAQLPSRMNCMELTGLPFTKSNELEVSCVISLRYHITHNKLFGMQGYNLSILY